MKVLENIGSVLAYIAGIFFIAFIGIGSFAAMVTANMQPDAWANSFIIFAPIVLVPLIAVTIIGYLERKTK